MRGSSLFYVLLLGSLSACLTPEAEEITDVESPVIGPVAAATSAVAPEHFVEVPPEATHIPLAFGVTDNLGISEIVVESHNAFDGHLHGRSISSNKFVLLDHRQTLLGEDLEDPTQFESQLDDEISIYLDERNPSLAKDDRVLAGPYHFSIKAVDASGNETSYDDNSTYHTTLHLQRSYAPRVRVDAVDRVTGSVNGTVARNAADSASSETVFLWVYVVRPDPARPAQEGEIRAEWLWGESNWPHQFRADSGEPLPGRPEIDLSALLSDEAAIRQMAGGDLLRVWAEDANGNITLRTFN